VLLPGYRSILGLRHKLKIMKNSLLLFTAILFLIMFLACKKDSDTAQSNGQQFANSPTCAYYSYEATGAGQYGQFITFFDLRSTTTAEKKFFKVQLKFQGVRDSFEVTTAPQSINSIAPGFPSEITAYPGYGWVNQWTNPQYRLLSTGGGSYYKDTIPRNPQSNIYYLYQNFLGGALKGEWPQSNFDNYSVPTGVNGQNTFYSRTIFYFKKGLCLKSDVSSQPELITSFYTGAPTVYDWSNIDAAIQIQQPATVPGVAAYNFYFFDFKNWRYFIWKQFGNPIFNNTVQLATTFEGYQSLNNFCKWPADWGKR
jgi:hypothetical protein